MKKLKLYKILCLFLFSLVCICVRASEEDEPKPLKTVTFRVYHLLTSIDEALKNEKDGKSIEYSYFSCKKNPHCQWISRERSVTAPHAWTLIAQGVGRELAGEDESERNKGEHWAYDIPAEASGCGEHFAIVWGMGEFFKSEKHTRPNPSGKDPYECWAIDREYGSQDFGYTIVSNLVEKPDESPTNGRLEGKPFIPFCSNLKGADFCSVTMSLATIDELPSLCDKLWGYSKSDSRGLYKTIYDKAGYDKTGAPRVVDLTKEILAHRPDASEEDAAQEEGEEFDVTIDGKDRKVVRVFGRFLTFEGFEEYIEKTKEDVRSLIAPGTLMLPDFDKKVLKIKPSEDDGEEEDEGDEGETAVSSDGKKKEKVDWEGLYNVVAAASQEGYVLLDKKCVSNVEICDVFVPEARQLVHVKIGTNSNVLNHLFGQGYASAKLLAHEDFSEKVILTLIRREVLDQMRKKMQERFAEVKDALWKQFFDWREKNKKKFEEKCGGKKENKVRVLIAKVESKEKRSEEYRTALKDLHKSLKGKDKEELGKILEAYEKEDASPEKEIAAFLTAQLKKTSTPLDMDCFPEDKIGFQKFCMDLRPFGKEDKELKELLEKLESYRVNAIEEHLENAWNKNEADMQAASKGPVKAYFPLFKGSPPPLEILETLSKQGHIPTQRCKIIFDNILAKYKQVKKHPKSNQTQFTEEDLEKILVMDDLGKLYEQLYAGFISKAEDSRLYQVVYAIITNKDPSDGNVLPLGARINLLRVAEDIRAIEGRKKFIPIVQIVSDITSGKKPSLKKSAVGPSFTLTRVSEGAAKKPAVKGASKKRGASSLADIPAHTFNADRDHMSDLDEEEGESLMRGPEKTGVGSSLLELRPAQRARTSVEDNVVHPHAASGVVEGIDGFSPPIPSPASSLEHLSPKTHDEENLDKNFGDLSLLSVGKQPKVHKFNKLKYLDHSSAGFFNEYMVCPTVGDGDCFFHAAFTEEGQGIAAVQERADKMRQSYVDAVVGGEYMEVSRNLLYEEYRKRQVEKDYGKIPDVILEMFKKNDMYDNARNSTIELIAAVSRIKPEDVDLSRLPDYLQNPPHSEDSIKEAITEDSIKEFISKLRARGGEETYVPFRPDMTCPAEILAQRNERRIHIFTYNPITARLTLRKSVGDPTHLTVNILHKGAHFVRLYNPSEGETARSQSKQIIKNSRE